MEGGRARARGGETVGRDEDRPPGGAGQGSSGQWKGVRGAPCSVTVGAHARECVCTCACMRVHVRAHVCAHAHAHMCPEAGGRRCRRTGWRGVALASALHWCSLTHRATLSSPSPSCVFSSTAGLIADLRGPCPLVWGLDGCTVSWIYDCRVARGGLTAPPRLPLPASDNRGSSHCPHSAGITGRQPFRTCFL